MNSDFRELLRSLSEAGARYLVVGGYAVMQYTEPRYTKDLDVWVGTDPANAPLVMRALGDFGAPLAELCESDLTQPDVFYQIGVAPVRVDILTSVSGVDFEEAWSRRRMLVVEGIQVPFISPEDLLASKEAAGRRQDRADARALRRLLYGKTSERG